MTSLAIPATSSAFKGFASAITADIIERGGTFIPLRSDNPKRPAVAEGVYGKGLLKGVSGEQRSALIPNGHGGNVGLLCGHGRIEMPDGTFRGVTAMDVDDKPERPDGKGGMLPPKNGSAELAELERKLGKLPQTLTQTTPSGARHLLFEMPESIDHVSTKALGSKLAIELQNEGHQIVFQGEITTEQVERNPGYIAGKYKWMDRSVPVARLPATWIAELVKVSHKVSNAIVAEEREYPRHLPPEWAIHAAVAAQGVSRDAPKGNRRLGMLAVAGALCSDSVVPRELIPAFCAAVVEASGGLLNDPEVKFKAAADTVDKYDSGGCSGYKKLREEYGWTHTADALPKRKFEHFGKPTVDGAGISPVATPDPPASSPSYAPADRMRRLVERGKRTRTATGFPSIDGATFGGIPAGTIVLIGGGPGAGKTSTAIQIGWNAMLGGAWLGIYAGDEPGDDIAIRLGQLLGFDRVKLQNGDPAECAAAGAALTSHPRLMLADAKGGELDPFSAALLKAADGAPTVLVPDSLQRVARTMGQDAERRLGVDALLDLLATLGARDAHVILAPSEVVRSAYGKDDETDDRAVWKESGGIEYAGQLAFVLRSRKGHRGIVDVTTPKNRIGVGQPAFTIILDEKTSGVRESGQSSAVAFTGNPLAVFRDRIREARSTWPSPTWKNQTELMGTFTGDPGKKCAAIKELIEEGALISDGRRIHVNARHAFWTDAPEPRKSLLDLDADPEWQAALAARAPTTTPGI